MRKAMSNLINKNKCVICDRELLCGNGKTNSPKDESLMKIINAAILRKNEKTFGPFEKAIMYLSDCSVFDLKSCQYHGVCFLKFIRNTKPDKFESESKQTASQPNKIASIAFEPNSHNGRRFLAEARIGQYIEDTVVKRETSLNMNDLSNQFSKYLMEEGISRDLTTVKKELKNYIQDNIKEVLVLRPPAKNKPEIVVSKNIVEKTYFEKSPCTHSSQCSVEENEQDKLIDALKILRKHFGEEEMWRFEGSFETYETNGKLHSFFKSLISGDFISEQPSKGNIVNRDATVLVQVIQFMMKSKRQMTHKGIEFRNSHETPMSVGLSLCSHFNSRSRKLVEELHSLDLGISYTKLKQIEDDIASSLTKIEDSTGGYVAPLWLQNKKFMCFAIDNIDFNEATCSGKNSLHGTGLCVIQRQSELNNVHKPYFFERQKNSKSFARLPCNFLHCEDPDPKPEIFALNIQSFDYNKTTESTDQTRLWMISYLNSDKKEESDKLSGLTWSTFHSFCSSESNSLTNIGLISPILRSPPTDYSALFTELQRAHNINTKYNGEGCKTVVGLDMQLFDMAMRLWVANEYVRSNFYFIAGPLHTVFWALQNLGTYIKDSGIENVWVESEMYSAKTVDKILSGKQMKRSLEAHITTVLALCQIYLTPKIEAHKNKKEMFELIDEIKKTLSELRQSRNEDRFTDSINKLKNKFKVLEFSATFNSQENDSLLQKFIFNYMKQVENILLYIKSIREANINLHISSLKDLIKYFFAHNNLTYARLLPLQLYIFQKIKTESPDLWKEFENGSFVVTKNNVKFVSIGLDHGMEQEIKKLKIKGGIIGITQNLEALDRYFTIAPVLSSIVDEFDRIYNPTNSSTNNVHHEFHGKKASRIQLNVQKMRNIFSDFGVGQEKPDDLLHNIFTKEVVSGSIANDIVDRDKRGYKLFEEFVDERLTRGIKTVWEPMHQSKIGTFSSNNATFESKTSAVGKIKEDRNLLQRFIVAARSRPDFDLKQVISKFEFGVVPRALFASDGNLLFASDTPRLVQYLEKITKTINMNDIPNTEKIKIYVCNGLEILNSMKRDCLLVNCNDLSKAFISKLSTSAAQFDEIHLIMETTTTNSVLINQTVQKKAVKSKNRFLIDDNTVIKNTSIKDLLSNLETKKTILTYLSLKALSHSKSVSNTLKRFCVSFNTVTEGNFKIEQRLVSHSHQSALTLSILHGSSFDKTSVATFESANNDLLFLLTYFHVNLPTRTIFRAGSGKQKRDINVALIREAVNLNIDSLLGYHAITGTTCTGKFSGKSKETTFKLFMNTLTSHCLAVLGDENEEIESIYTNVEEFICRIYKSPNDSIEDTRWFLFSQEAAPEDMPPTKSPLMLHLLRAHYITMIWKKALQSHPVMPLPSDFGWKSDGEVFKPIMNLDPPAPDTLTQLVKCNCRTGCKNARCSCRKNCIPCTEMCGCHNFNCENHFDLYNAQLSEEESDDSEI